MVLRPHVKTFLDSIPAQDPAISPTPAELRRSQQSRIVPPEQRPPVGRVDDRVVLVEDRRLSIRQYRPSTDPGLPLLLYFHGGGFTIGSLDSHDGICRRLASDSGWTVVAVDYRLAPEHPFPTGVEDCYTVTRWCYENAHVLDIDPTRIAVAGDSSGGNFAAVVAMMARDRGMPGICKQVLICPNTAFYQTQWPTPYASYGECGFQYLTTAAGISQFWSWYIPNVTDAHHPYVSPVEAHDLSRLPSALILTAEYDPLRDEGEVYARRLRDAGVPVQAIRYGGTIHGFLGMFPDEDEGRQARAAIRQFLDEGIISA